MDIIHTGGRQRQEVYREGEPDGVPSESEHILPEQQVDIALHLSRRRVIIQKPHQNAF